MSATRIQIALLSLLRIGLWGKKENTEMLPLSSEQWKKLYDYVLRHTIEGVVYDAFQRLPVDLLPPRDLMLKWTVRVDQIERHHKQMNACIREQLDLFYSQGIEPMLLKGQGVSACYDIPEHRICGDIDWYFGRRDQYLEANDLFRKIGIEVSDTAGFSSAYVWRDIVIEHHQRLFDIHNPFSYSFLDRLETGLHYQRLEHDIQGARLFLPAPMLMMLQVNAHILKHLLSFGLGIRQLCDAARVYHRFRKDVDGQELMEVYRKLGILKWIHLLHSVLVKYIGLPAESLPFELVNGVEADWMMDDVWSSGNFGFYDSGRQQAARRIWSNMKKYVKYAPMETISFPLMQFYSKFGRS